MQKNPIDMYVLGIESTAHTFGISIIKGKEILVNIKDSYISDEHGMIPIELSKHHEEVYLGLIKKALLDANISINNIDLISFSRGPGMGHALRVGSIVAKSIAYNFNIPIIGVNHCIAHLNAGKLVHNDIKDPILLYVSGANTQVIAYEDKKYRVFGETLDTGIGNFLDSFARDLGFGFPGGPIVSKYAEKSKNFIKLPYTVKGMDVSFGGIQTNLKQKFQKGYSKEDLCFSAQESVFAMMIEVTERALSHTGKKEVLLGGGVACNTRLQEMTKLMCEKRGAKCFILPNSLNVDNAAMIAWEGLLEYTGKEKIEIEVVPYQRTDDITFKENLNEISDKYF